MYPLPPTSARTTLPSTTTRAHDANFDWIVKIVLPIFAIIASFALFPLESAITLSALIALVSFAIHQCSNDQLTISHIDPTPKPAFTTREKIGKVERIHFRRVPTAIHFSPKKPPKIIETIMTYLSPERNLRE